MSKHLASNNKQAYVQAYEQANMSHNSQWLLASKNTITGKITNKITRRKRYR